MIGMEIFVGVTVIIFIIGFLIPWKTSDNQVKGFSGHGMTLHVGPVGKIWPKKASRKRKRVLKRTLNSFVQGEFAVNRSDLCEDVKD